MKHDVSGLATVWNLRGSERRLFAALLAAFLAGYTMVWLALAAPDARLALADLAPPALFATALLAIHLGLVLFRCKGDAVLLSAALFLAGLGFLAQIRLGNYSFDEPRGPADLVFPIGILIMLAITAIFQNGATRLLEPLWPLFWLGAVGIIVATLAFGTRFRGAVFLPGNINPTELSKVLLVLFLAGYIARQRDGLRAFSAAGSGSLALLAVLWLVPMGLLLLQRDLGMLVLLNMVLVAMLFTGTGRWAYPLVFLPVAAAVGFALFRFAAHARGRLDTWMDPFRDPTGTGWQILQGLSAMFTGGLLGRGLGSGSPHQVPIASSDFIYAVLGEELGYVGSAVILTLYLVFVYRGYRTATCQSNPFEMLLAAGLTTLLGFQALLNVGGVTKAIPMTGITLPFISHGGSSLLAVFSALGLLLAMSEQVLERRPKNERVAKHSKRGKTSRGEAPGFSKNVDIPDHSA